MSRENINTQPAAPGVLAQWAGNVASRTHPVAGRPTAIALRDASRGTFPAALRGPDSDVVVRNQRENPRLSHEAAVALFAYNDVVGAGTARTP
jgi:hypothetical protein